MNFSYGLQLQTWLTIVVEEPVINDYLAFQ